MNDRTDIERTLTTWFDDGPSTMPDRVAVVVADRIAHEPQRRAWRLPWRQSPMNPTFKIAAGVAAVLVIAVVGWSLLPGGPLTGVGGPGPSPAPSTSTAPSPDTRLCPTSDPACTGRLMPGTHSTNALITPVSFTVPDGWSKPLDVAGAVNLEPTDPNGFVAVWPDWNAASQDRCISAPGPDPGVGRTAQDLVSWLTQQPGFVTTSPEAVTIGGLDGLVVDLQKDPEVPGTCDGAINVFTHQGTLDDIGWLDVRDGQRMRLYFFDVGDGHVINVAIIAKDSAQFASVLAEATPVVESLAFR